MSIRTSLLALLLTCLSRTIYRGPVLPISSLGSSSLGIDVTAPPNGAPAFIVGQTISAQFFFRDVCPPSNANFSSASQYVTAP